jgi:hypothetical protein
VSGLWYCAIPTLLVFEEYKATKTQLWSHQVDARIPVNHLHISMVDACLWAAGIAECRCLHFGIFSHGRWMLIVFWSQGDFRDIGGTATTAFAAAARQLAAEIPKKGRLNRWWNILSDWWLMLNSIGWLNFQVQTVPYNGYCWVPSFCEALCGLAYLHRCWGCPSCWRRQVSRGRWWVTLTLHITI